MWPMRKVRMPADEQGQDYEKSPAHEYAHQLDDVVCVDHELLPGTHVGVVTVGLFAARCADQLIVGTPGGVEFI